MKELIILGSGGWIPTPQRQTCCYLLRTKKTLLLIDAGSGISNLCKIPEIINNYDEINIILSHYHLDHTIGISYLLNWINKTQKINIWGPGKPHYLQNCNEIVSKLIGGVYFSRPIKKYSENVNIFNFPSKSFQIGDFNIETFLQNHSAPSFGIKVDDILYYATDTDVTIQTFNNAKNCKLLLHECWEITKKECKGKHSSFEELQEYINNCFNIEMVRLIHLNPNLFDNKEITLKNQLKGYKNIKLAEDFDIIKF